MVVLRHSWGPPSGVASRARGTRTVTAPNVPIRLRSRWPWRWPDTGDLTASALGPVSGVGFRPRSGGFCKEPEHPRRAEWQTDDPGDGLPVSIRPKRFSA